MDETPTAGPAPLSRRSFLKGAAGIALAGPGLASLLQAQPGSGPLMAYVGTYSSPPIEAPPGKVDLPPGNGRGIHIFRVNRATGELSPAGICESTTSPSALVTNAAGTRMYSTNATASLDEQKMGAINSYAIDRATGQLTLLNIVAAHGVGPTYISLHPSGKFALVASYGGTVSVYPMRPDGSLGEACDVKKSGGKIGPKRATNSPPGSFAVSGHDVPHAHMILPDASGRFVISIDLASDQIMVWKFDAQAGKLSLAGPPVNLPPGDGPRHFAFHPQGKWMYCLQEEASTIVLFDYDSNTGALSARQTISSLPPGFAGSSFSSEILVSQDGRFVYAGNRLHDTVATLAIGPDGTLTWIGEEWTRGDYPRSFNFDPTGNFVYCCNQRADNVTAFRVDKGSGRLTFTGFYAPVGNPSAITFLDLGSPA